MFTAIAALGLSVAAPQPALPSCPRGAVIEVVYGHARPVCDLHRGNRLDVHFLGSDGIERPYFRRIANHHGATLVWRMPYGRPGSGHFVAEDWDF
jgi:hypothetical protein